MSDFDISMYRDMFLEEAEELFESADNVLLEAEKNGSLTEDEMSQLFRDVHTLKGSGASVELKYFAEFTHDVENMMDKLRKHEIEYQESMAGTLIDGLDVMREILQLECDDEMDDDKFKEMSTEILTTIRAYMNGETVSEETSSQTQASTTTTDVTPQTTQSSDNSFETSPYGYYDGIANSVVSNSTSSSSGSKAFGFFGEDELESSENSDFGFFSEAEPIENELAKEQTKEVEVKKEEPKKTVAKKEAPKKEAPKKAVAKKDESKKSESKKAVTNNIRVNLDKIDNLMNNVGDLVITNAMLNQFATTIEDSKTRSTVLERLELLERHIREMQDSIMNIRMVPMDSIYSKFPKVIRDISKKVGKKVEFKHEGDSVEIDKAMIEGLTDPLMHIIRNSLDHGLETPEERVANGKSETGTITIAAEQANGQMIISIVDDGRGIAFEKVAQKALENGDIDEKQYESMSDNDKAMLIFGAGLSTAEEITEISGRGVGMDVVKTNIQKLGGAIRLETKENVGTTITIALPLTLAILDGLDIAIGNMKYILPLSSIVESLQPTSEMIKKIGDGSQELLMLREEFIPIVRLYQLFGIESKHKDIEDGMLIVVKSGSEKIAIFIDEFLHQHQVVVKPLDKNFKTVEGIGAATVRGDGSIGLILDIIGIIDVQKKFEFGGTDFTNTSKQVS
jgi:two-component system chemotaxis sensor kinase CheA